MMRKIALRQSVLLLISVSWLMASSAISIVMAAGSFGTRDKSVKENIKQYENNQTNSLALRLSLDDKPSPARVVVIAELHNKTQRSIELLPWSTPLSSLVDGAIFMVSRDGHQVPYQGLQLKRLAPTAEDFIKMAPDSIVEKALDISMSYDFCSLGHYRIAFAGKLMQRNTASLMLASNTVEFVVTDQRFCQQK